MTLDRDLRVVAGVGLLLALPALAAPVSARVRTGVEFGVNVSAIRYDDESAFPRPYYDQHWRPSMTGGVTLEFPLRDGFALATGLRYVQEGNRVEFDWRPLFNTAGRFRIVHHYLGLPVRAVLRPLPSRRFFASLGPEVVTLIAGRSVIEASSSPGVTHDDITNDLARFALMLDAEAGVEFPVSAHTGVVSVRYAHGLTHAAKKDHWASDWTTRGVECLLGARW